MNENNSKSTLPIDVHLDKISEAFKHNANLILTASPGTGKTTRVPPYIISAGLLNEKKMVVLVPKRIAATSAAARVADEEGWSLGHEVGYQVRFDNKTGSETKLIYMTEGVFIRKISDEDFWGSIGAVVFDEFHERSSTIDLALGICVERQISGEDLKLIVMSATLDATKLKNFLPDSNWFEVENKIYPLHIIKSKKSQRLACDQLFADHLVDTLTSGLRTAKRDALVFLPGLSEIRFVERAIKAKLKQTPIQILHGSVSLNEQREILNYRGERRIILATNIAESSITVSSVDLVIDSGLEKKSIRENKVGFSRLEVVRISQFSATQRAGRAARTSEGFCYQLWHELDERSMPLQIEPEILTSNLLEESLTLSAAGVSSPENFSWVDKPKASFGEARSKLTTWGLIDSSGGQTKKGLQVRNCPLDIERALLFIELSLAGYQREASRFLAYLETTSFDKLIQLPDWDDPALNDQGRKIESQLLRFSVGKAAAKEGNFRSVLLHIFFRLFPHKIAKKREKNHSVSSLGRGLEMSNVLVRPDHDFYLLFSGREISSALTFCDFALSFSQAEFDKASADEVQQQSEFHLDIDNKKIYKIERKRVGNFIIKESPKIYVDEKKESHIFNRFFEAQFSELLKEHSDYKEYNVKIDFLKKKSVDLGLTEANFSFLFGFERSVQQAILGSIASLQEFFNFRLNEILIFCTPDSIRDLITDLPSNLKLPSGKIVPIEYFGEQAPKVSARMQEFYGMQKHPTILGGKMRLTVELLAPNYRPTQTTGQLENFWKSGYHEIKKELKARYPRHAWPDDPSTYIHVPKK